MTAPSEDVAVCLSFNEDGRLKYLSETSFKGANLMQADMSISIIPRVKHGGGSILIWIRFWSSRPELLLKIDGGIDHGKYSAFFFSSTFFLLTCFVRKK